MKKLYPKAFICALLLTLFGCAELISFLPKVISIVTDAQLILDKIEDHANAFFAVSPDPKLQRGVDQALDRCRTALSVALRTTHGAENLTQKDVDAAFDNFRKAYKNLLVLVQPLGVMEGAPGDKLAATPEGLVVPPPLALGS
jgi:hypothetical protein